MLFRNALKRWAARLSLAPAVRRVPGRRPSSRRLQIEPLEERSTPTANVTALTAATDTGSLNTDEVTSDTTPTIVGTAVANSTVEVFDGNTSLGTTTADSAGNWAFAVPGAKALAEGSRDIKATDSQGTGTHLTVVIDTTAPAVPPAPTLLPASDSGTAGDNRTTDTTPTLTGTAAANSTVEILDGATSLGTTTANGSGVWSFTPNASLAEGTHSLTVKAIDLAGNTSAASGALSVAVDLTAPNAPLGLTLDPGSDSGTQGDNQTEDSTPTITGTAEANGIVTVFEGATSLGTATVAANGTWSFTPVIPLSDGPHTLTARVTDGAGNLSALSTGLTLTIDDNTAPAAPSNLTLDPASDGGTQGDNRTADTTPTITGTAEPGSTVTVFDGPTSLGTTVTQSNGTWSFTPAVALGAGDHTFTATATDTGGNPSVVSANLVVNIDLTVPAVPSAPTLAPTSDSGTTGDGRTNDNTPTLTGTAEANVIVEILDGTTSLGTTTADGSGNWSFTPGTALSDGSHSLTARTRSTAGGTSAASAALTLVIDTTTTTPSGLTLAPASDSGTTGDNRTSDTTPTLTGTAEANAVVTVRDGSTTLGTATADSSGAWTFTPSTALTEGSHSITATATDAAGNTSNTSSTLTLVIDVTAPATPAAPTLTTGSDSGTLGDNRTNDTTPTLSGTTEANGIVEVFDGATSLGTATANGSGAWTFTPATALTEGNHVLTVKTKDTAGNTSASSASLTVTLDTTAPATPSAPDLVAGADTGLNDADNITARTTPTFTGTAEAGSTIRVLDGTRLLGTTVAGADGSWTFISPPLSEGNHTIVVTATDVAGNVSTVSAGQSITIDSTGRLANPLTDVTSRVSIARSKPRRVRTPRPGRRRRGPARRRPSNVFRQTVTITNTTGRTLEGPLFLALDGLSSGVRLQGGSTGRSPFIQVLPANGSLAAGQSVTIVLTFTNPTLQAIQYTPRVMTGFGTL